MEKIFVQIASYRDRQLVPTIKDILAKAKYPERLTFGICWQHDPTEDLDEYKHDARFRIIAVKWNESKGCGWARSKTQSLYKGEEYTFQIDSHTRFIEGWDEVLIKMVLDTNDPKPIITYYPPPYELLKNGETQLSKDNVPQALVINNFESGFIPFCRSTTIPNIDNMTVPTRGKFIAAGMLFTIGKFCVEVPYNPNIYFFGEEMDIALRSFTKGYNVYHPHKNICWHYFFRKEDPKHWSDHTARQAANGVIPRDYISLTNDSYKALRELFQGDNSTLGIYAVGNVRSRRAFELHAGINFRKALMHPDAGTIKTPVTTDTEWEKHAFPPRRFTKTIKLDLSRVSTQENYSFWYFGLHDKNNVEIYRNDIKTTDYLIKRKDEVYIDTILDRDPVIWTLWPVSTSKGWLEKITKPI